MWYYALLFALFATRKVVDQRRSGRNLAELARARRILPEADRAYPFLLVTHLAFFILTPLEIVLMGRRFKPLLGISMIGLFLSATLLRSWTVSLLDEYWSSRVAVPEDLAPVTSGPYRFIRHPNYLAMSLEFLAMGLIYSAYLSTLLVAVLNAVAVAIRIRDEEAVLFQVPAYRMAMQSKARLVPGVY
jgi:methyltransferase